MFLGVAKSSRALVEQKSIFEPQTVREEARYCVRRIGSSVDMDSCE